VAGLGAEPPPAPLPVIAGALADALLDVLGEAARLGFLGPGPVERHVDHAARFAAVLRPASTVLDLGSGGGVPGLVLAALRPEARIVLLDARRQRTDFLERAVGRLGWGGRVTVVAGRAEEVGRSPTWRGRMPAVVARSFASPPTTAECAAPLLLVGGQLVVSEPPDAADERWPAAALSLVGLALDGRAQGLVSLTQVSPCPGRFPRRRHEPDLFHVKRP
jgi:16S rRNA (guanine527-N7)-methyltransferase